MPLRATSFVLAIILVLLMINGPAMAHTGDGYGGGFVAGFTHPILGWDHVAAMVVYSTWESPVKEEVERERIKPLNCVDSIHVGNPLMMDRRTPVSPRMPTPN